MTNPAPRANTAPAPRFRAASPTGIWEGDSPAAVAASARRADARGPIAVEYAIGSGPWLPALTYAASIDAEWLDRAAAI